MNVLVWNETWLSWVGHRYAIIMSEMIWNVFVIRVSWETLGDDVVSVFLDIGHV